MRKWIISGFLLLPLLCFGCGPTHQQLAPDDAKQKWLSFVENGKTTREELLLKLGTPSGRFQGDRILTYRLIADGEVLTPAPFEVMYTPHMVSGWRENAYNLVVVFDENGVAQKHSFIKVK